MVCGHRLLCDAQRHGEATEMHPVRTYSSTLVSRTTTLPTLVLQKFNNCARRARSQTIDIVDHHHHQEGQLLEYAHGMYRYVCTYTSWFAAEEQVEEVMKYDVWTT